MGRGSSAPTLTKGFHLASEDISATKKFVVCPGSEHYKISENTEVINVVDFLKMLVLA